MTFIFRRLLSFLFLCFVSKVELSKPACDLQAALCACVSEREIIYSAISAGKAGCCDERCCGN